MNLAKQNAGVRKTTSNGFSLIELMVAVAIVGILAAIAYPSYQQYVVRGNRAAAQSEMMDIANREQQYLLANRSYASDGALGYTPSNDINKYYGCPTAGNCIAVGTGTVPSFTITLRPVSTSMQKDDGDLVLTSNGLKTRDGDSAKW